MRKALLLAMLFLAADPGCMWISLRFDPWQLPPVLPPEIQTTISPNTPATLQSPQSDGAGPAEGTAPAAPQPEPLPPEPVRS